MRAARVHGIRDLRVECVEDPVPDADQVLIEIRACGVCPSDVRWFDGGKKSDVYPRQIGHEWVGVVREVGAEVEGFAPGDRVAAEWRVVCGECDSCRRGLANYCTRTRRERVRGGYCELGVAIPRNLRRIPDNVSFEEACFTEPLACCLNGQRNTPIEPGDDVVVIGAGQIGLMHAQLAKHRGARVLVCDRIASRLEKAREIGADETISVDEEDAVAAVMERTESRGANAVIVAAGSAAAASTALDIAAVNATINLFAGFYGTHILELDLNRIHYKQIRLTGSHDFTPHDFTTALKLIETGIVDVKTLISHRFLLDDIHEALETVERREGLKVVVHIGG